MSAETLLRDLITIPESVSEGDFVVRASEGADLVNYVVTDQLRDSFGEALRTVGHAVTTGRSQAKFLHGSFGSGKSHFMAVLREILAHNPAARAVRGLAGPVAEADAWLAGCEVLTLTFHMLDAVSVEQAVLEGYLHQIMALRPDAAPPAVHRSDALLRDAAKIREDIGDEKFFARLGAATSPGGGGGLAAARAQAAGWTAGTYTAAAAAAPGTRERDALVSALTATLFTSFARAGEYLDLDTGLQVITRHAKSLGYDVMVLFLDEMILWLSTRISDHTFVNTEGAKLNKLVESSDAARPLPIVAFVARQRNLEDFLGPQVGGTEREALAHVMRSVQGRLGNIVLADTNLPEITEKRLLRPREDAPGARKVIDDAFATVRGNRAVWDTLLLGAQYGDAGIGSDADAFRKLYPFSPALVATLVALSQALQRERTALRVMTELLVARRDTLRVNDLIGVASLFEPLVLHGELPDRPALKQHFQAARDTYTQKLRPMLLARNGITEEQAAGHTQFALDDRLVKTLLLGALVPEVPALHNLTASRLHALNFGSIASPVPGYENQIVIDRLSKLAADAGELHKTEGPDPVFSIKLSSVDYDKLLELVPHTETTTGVLQQLIRELVCADLGIGSVEGTFGDLPHMREWRGRRHQVDVRFGNVRDSVSMPDAVLYAAGDTWRVIIDYPFDAANYGRSADHSRIERLDRGSRTVFWLPLFFTDELMTRVGQLARINFLLGTGGTGDRLNTYAQDWSVADRQQGKVYLQQRQTQLRGSLADSLKQAYGVSRAQESDVRLDPAPVLQTLAEGLGLGDPRGGTLKAAFDNLTAELLRWTYPGKPALPEDEKPIGRAELGKVLHYARLAANDPTHGVAVETADRKTIQRICHPLRLGEMPDHRYVLTGATCWWSQYLPQEAAKRGHTDRLPVRVLRELLNPPQAWGFDRDLENLIIAVVALEQQLVWYLHDGPAPVNAVQMVSDQMELRRPVMPAEPVYRRAVGRAKALFGKTGAEWMTPSTVAEFCALMRSEAGRYAVPAIDLVRVLDSHAGSLGLDPDARTGRLASARRVARALRDIAAERDDNVLVELVAQADLGEIDDAAAAEAFKQADKVIAALGGTQWPLLAAVAERAGREGGDEEARLIIDGLQAAARHDQQAQDLVTALARAVDRSATFLARQERPPFPPDGADAGGAGGSTGGGLDRRSPGLDGGQATGHRAAQSSDVTTANVTRVLAEIQAEVDTGRTVRVTWQVVA